MLTVNGPILMSVPRRVGLRFIALLLAVGLFSLLWFLMPSVGSVSIESLSAVFLVTLLYAPFSSRLIEDRAQPR